MVRTRGACSQVVKKGSLSCETQSSSKKRQTTAPSYEPLPHLQPPSSQLLEETEEVETSEHSGTPEPSVHEVLTGTIKKSRSIDAEFQQSIVTKIPLGTLMTEKSSMTEMNLGNARLSKAPIYCCNQEVAIFHDRYSTKIYHDRKIKGSKTDSCAICCNRNSIQILQEKWALVTQKGSILEKMLLMYTFNRIKQ